MLNVLLDPLPTDWNGYPIDPDFQIGIQISQCMADESLSNTERFYMVKHLLFPDENNCPEDSEVPEAVKWYLTEYIHDHHDSNANDEIIMDWDVDQWRIYAAFRSQYHIDLNKETLHWFTFMGLLSNLEECAFTRIMDIRQRKITSKMSKEEKTALRAAKKIFEIKTPEDKISPEEKERIEKFLKYANINKEP